MPTIFTPAGPRACLAGAEKVPILCHIHYPPAEVGIAWSVRYLPKPAMFVFCSHALQYESGPSLRSYCPRSRQVVVQNSISLDLFDPTPVAHDAVHRVGVVANLLPVKGHVDFLDMAAELTARGVEAEYWIIGEDVHRTGYKAELHNRTRELGLEDRVCFRGYCRNVPNLLRELDVVVCSSHVEPFGMCVLEAMACAKPVVATRVGGLPEVVDDGVSGILVPPHAPGRLADAVERLLENPELRITFGRFGRTRAATHFSHEVYVDKMLALYQELTREHPPARSQQRSIVRKDGRRVVKAG